MISYINKDLTTVTEGLIVHGCNCQGVMGSGVAAALRNKWPKIFEPYKKQCDKFKDHKEELLGDFVYVYIQENLIIINAFTQENYSKDGKVYASVDAIKEVLQECVAIAFLTNLPLYLPRIGCGLGGLDWEIDVGPIVEVISKQYQEVDIYVCDL